ncbi:GntR family transcriptional regulator [Oceanimonas pelagia]|uniref:GntR family transcriptional regulator n=1 Tax=Oceanimonas pelagia TaxID=3028314 RepID=A0AA50KN29_9GAMM|nr:GntR family transcriptional regulator [Oceanimonas pelagia]WMC11191.1 GntR family transcriptional regulator [Oceanimonas pelagia]
MTTAKKKEIRRIVDAVGRAIVEQRLAPGTRLVEVRLAEALQANRNHIRDALQELSHQGLVSMVVNKGAMVACPSQQEATDVFVVRRLLEAEAVVLAAARIDAAGIAALQTLIDEERRAVDEGRRAEAVQLAARFHLEVARIADNQVLLEMLERLLARCSLIVSMYQKNRQAHNSHCDEHGRLVALLAAGKVDEAVHAMNRHLEHLESTLDLTQEEEPETDFMTLFAEQRPA